MRRARDQRGTATAFVIGFAVVLLACAGLVIDGGTVLNARMRLADDTEQAARAGAQEIDVEYLRRSNVVSLDQVAAANRADAYLGSIGYRSYRSAVVRSGNGQSTSVRVDAQDTVPTTMLRLVNISSFTIRATATAQAVTQLRDQPGQQPAAPAPAPDAP
jgi:Flp pilus assembly protein TadG